jgi:Cu(I)/Ag(I) efflux system protein CusF
MKRLAVLSAIVVLSLAAPALLHAQSDTMRGMDMQGAGKTQVKTHKGVGTVKKIDSARGKVTIAHGPIPTMKWPAMNMAFTVKDKALLGKVSQDKKVEFEFVQQGSDYVITSVK